MPTENRDASLQGRDMSLEDRDMSPEDRDVLLGDRNVSLEGRDVLLGDRNGSPGARERSFWRMPPPWVWLLFALSVGVLSASMLTFREGRRFVSRELQPRELRTVAGSLALWQRSAQDSDAAILRAMLKEGRILAMDQGSFSRVQERATFGYTDEHGRILLNPNLCFANQRARGLHQPDSSDTVATLFTLYHESRHLFDQATEATAYEDEWRFVRDSEGWPTISRDATLITAVGDWEKDLPGRIELYVDKAQLASIRSRLEQPGTSRVVDDRAILDEKG